MGEMLHKQETTCELAVYRYLPALHFGWVLCGIWGMGSGTKIETFCDSFEIAAFQSSVLNRLRPLVDAVMSRSRAT
ncbi:MAG: hypothetical protein U1D69_00785 [Polynucleobacter sp.]|nr:hypothetical protein [Polynucleobacter sp.]